MFGDGDGRVTLGGEPVDETSPGALTEPATERPEHSTNGAPRVTVVTLTGVVVGSMVGAGVFSLPRRFATETGVYGALIAWAIAGTGMLMLAFVFQTLAVRKPSLDSGVYAYAKAGSANTSVSSPRSAIGPARASATSPTGSSSCRRSARSHPGSARETPCLRYSCRVWGSGCSRC